MVSAGKFVLTNHSSRKSHRSRSRPTRRYAAATSSAPDPTVRHLPLLPTHQTCTQGHIDFKTDPWPKISEAAKDCVKRLLDQDVTKRATAAQILKHEWLVKEGVALDIALDSVVLKRLKQFAQMNKLKKACLMVIGQHLTPDEIAGAWEAREAEAGGQAVTAEVLDAVGFWTLDPPKRGAGVRYDTRGRTAMEGKMALISLIRMVGNQGLSAGICISLG